jgi:5-formyltetrahydrofolate cyclo-ligase
MITPIQSSKRALRRQVLEVLKNLSPASQAEASAKARALLQGQPRWQQARSVLFFAPMPGELDVWPLMEAALLGGKGVALPRFVPAAGRYVACQVRDPGTDVCSGHFGIREPAAWCEQLEMSRFDLLLVPGVAFDLQGHRLGRGKGYYDQLLEHVRGTTCGVGFDEQMVLEIPVEPHDQRLNCILTPTRWVES